MNINKLLISAHELLISEKIDQAEKKLNQIIQIDPKNIYALNNLGSICIKKKN